MPSRSLDSVQKACAARTSFLKDQESRGTNAFRLFCGAREGIEGFIIEKYAGVLIFQWHVGKCTLTVAELKEIADWMGPFFSCQAIYLKKFMADRSHSTIVGEQDPEQLYWGVEVGERVEISENGNRYWIKPAEGLSTGIFLDQRENRKYLAETLRPTQVLNCFAYTCAFSVALAKVGATVTSVDLSKKNLEWGKDNFRLNTIDPSQHYFYAQDCFEYFKLANKKQRKFDLIILDPPSFSRGSRGGVFSVKNDMERLIVEALSLLSPGGTLFASTNFAQWDTSLLKTAVMKAVQSTSKAITWIELPETPEDFRKESHLLSACAIRIW